MWTAFLRRVWLPYWRRNTPMRGVRPVHLDALHFRHLTSANDVLRVRRIVRREADEPVHAALARR
jgi:hypothetical protein